MLIDDSVAWWNRRFEASILFRVLLGIIGRWRSHLGGWRGWIVGMLRDNSSRDFDFDGYREYCQ